MVESEHEEFLHPNADGEGTEITEGREFSKSAYIRMKAKYRKNTCANYFRRFDKFIMRPIFIYNYNEGKTKKNDEFMELFFKDADKLEEIYTNED